MMPNKGQKTILITGGHLTPAMALIQALNRLMPKVKIVYVGRSKYPTGKASVERGEVTRLGARYQSIVAGKLYRYLTIAQLKEVIKIPIGLIKASWLMIKEKPRVVVSFGGYLSVPLVLAAWSWRIPIVVHEQTTVLGAANRFARRLAKVVAVSWPDQQAQGVVLTGNPIPREILAAGKLPRIDSAQPVLVVTEGSQGSKVISTAIGSILPSLVKRFVVYHQTPYPALMTHPHYRPASWFTLPDYARILRSATIAVSRSGANTVTYHAYLGVPSIFIPLQVAADNEQLENARLLGRVGLARIIPQSELTPVRLQREIENFTLPREDAKSITAKAKALVRPAAADALADIVAANL